MRQEASTNGRRKPVQAAVHWRGCFVCETGFSFNEWRSRLRAIDGLARLSNGEPVGTAAASVGYAQRQRLFSDGPAQFSAKRHGRSCGARTAGIPWSACVAGITQPASRNDGCNFKLPPHSIIIPGLRAGHQLAVRASCVSCFAFGCCSRRFSRPQLVCLCERSARADGFRRYDDTYLIFRHRSSGVTDRSPMAACCGLRACSIATASLSRH